MLDMHAASKPSQAERIRKAVEEAARRRDRYADDRVADLNLSLKAASDDVAKQIRRFEERAALKPWQEMRLAILKDLEKEIDGVAADLQSAWKVGLRAHAEGSMQLGIEDGIKQLEALQMPDFKDLSDIQRKTLIIRTFSTIDRAAVDFLANYELTLLGDVSTELAGGIKRTIAQGVLEGKSIPEVTRDIGQAVKDPDAFKTAGKTIFKTAQQRAMLIARTETLRAHNEGRKVFYREVGVKKVRWITAHDERTCPICAPRDGMIYPIDSVPEEHPAGRCTVVAVMEV